MPISKELIEVSKLPWFPNVMKELGYEPVRHGYWIGDICSECGKDALCDCDRYDIYGTIHSDYCPHCGAKMDEVV